MLNFFNSKNKWNASVQAYNMLVLTIATYDLATNPDSTWSEMGADVFVHAVTLLSLQENASLWTGLTSTFLNAARFGAIWSGATSGSSSVALALNGIDAANHIVNAATSFLSSCDKSIESPPDATKPKR
jgi:hypothetical protein